MPPRQIKVMRIGTKRDDGVSVVGGRIEEVDEFIYLGSIVRRREALTRTLWHELEKQDRHLRS